MTLLTLLLCLVASPLLAQTPVEPTPTTQLAWDHDGIHLDGFRLTIDAATTADLGLPPRQPGGFYQVPFPALTPGVHTLVVVAYNISGSAPSEALRVQVIILPARPTNLRVLP